MMFYGDGDQVTLDSNYIHDCSGRAPKLGDDSTTCYVQAVNNYFANMDGHAFEAYGSATALIEGNVFDAVENPFDENAQVDTCYTVSDEAAASACSSALGRECAINSLTGSGDWPALGTDDVLSTFATYADYLVDPKSADEVASYVQANAGPANLGSGSGSSSGATTTAAAVTGKPTGGYGGYGGTTMTTKTRTKTTTGGSKPTSKNDDDDEENDD